jgi:hypothetical protein
VALGAPAARPATTAAVLRELKRASCPAQAANLRRFFKTGPGEYGAGDEFWGLQVPQTRAILARFSDVPLAVAGELLASLVHEARFFALAALVRAYARARRRAPEVFDFYLATRRASTIRIGGPQGAGIVGRHLPPGKAARPAALADSPNLWEPGASRWSPRGNIRQAIWPTFLAGDAAEIPKTVHKHG